MRTSSSFSSRSWRRTSRKETTPCRSPPHANGQVAETVPLHQGPAGLDLIARGDGQRILGHDLADRRTGGILAGDHHAAHQVAFGEDSGELAILQNWHRSDVVFHHHAGDFEDCLVSFGGYCDLIPEQIADQHLNLPLMTFRRKTNCPANGIETG